MILFDSCVLFFVILLCPVGLAIQIVDRWLLLTYLWIRRALGPHTDHHISIWEYSTPFNRWWSSGPSNERLSTQRIHHLYKNHNFFHFFFSFFFNFFHFFSNFFQFFSFFFQFFSFFFNFFEYYLIHLMEFSRLRVPYGSCGLVITIQKSNKKSGMKDQLIKWFIKRPINAVKWRPVFIVTSQHLKKMIK